MHWKYSVLVLLKFSLGVVADTQCATGYATKDNRICYKYYPLAANQSTAAAQCAMDGGYLASVSSQFNDGFLGELMGRNTTIAWLGITCSGSQDSCKNDDGTPFGPYANFRARTDFNSFPSTSCVYKLYSTDYYDNWDTDSCEDSMPFVCELPVGSLCRYGYSFWRGSCYSVSSDTANEKDAQDRCSGNNANLASIHSDDVNDYILSLAKTKRLNSTLVRIGLKTNGFNRFSWTDGSPTNYTSKIAYSDTDVGECFGFAIADRLVKEGNWSSVNCLSNMPYVCKAGKIYEDKMILAPLQCNATNELEGTGTIYSPGYPLPYARSDCYYQINVPWGQKVKLDFPTLNLATGSTITIFDDSSEGD